MLQVVFRGWVTDFGYQPAAARRGRQEGESQGPSAAAAACQAGQRGKANARVRRPGRGRRGQRGQAGQNGEHRPGRAARPDGVQDAVGGRGEVLQELPEKVRREVDRHRR